MLISLFASDTAIFFSLLSYNCPLHLHQVLIRDLHTLSNWSNLWNVKFNPAKNKVLTISKPHISHTVFIFNSVDLSETDSYKYLRLIFHQTLPWHHHILRLNKRPHLDYGNVIFANCSTSDSLLVEHTGLHMKAAKLTLGQCSSTFLSSRNPWYTFAFVMEPYFHKFKRHKLLVTKSSTSLLDTSTNKQLLQNLQSKKFNGSLVLAFLEFSCYIQNLVIRQKEPVSEICVVPFSNFGNWMTFGPLRIRYLFYNLITLLNTVHTFAVVIISLHICYYFRFTYESTLH